MRIKNIFPFTKNDSERVEIVAQIAHAANLEYCKRQMQYEILPWEYATDDIKASAMDGVQKILDNPGLTPEEAHQNWMEFKKKTGWSFAEGIRDYERKTHPCLKPYSELSEREKLKDVLFHAIVTSFAE